MLVRHSPCWKYNIDWVDIFRFSIEFFCFKKNCFQIFFISFWLWIFFFIPHWLVHCSSNKREQLLFPKFPNKELQKTKHHFYVKKNHFPLRFRSQSISILKHRKKKKKIKVLFSDKKKNKLPLESYHRFWQQHLRLLLTIQNHLSYKCIFHHQVQPKHFYFFHKIWMWKNKKIVRKFEFYFCYFCVMFFTLQQHLCEQLIFLPSKLNRNYIEHTFSTNLLLSICLHQVSKHSIMIL